VEVIRKLKMLGIVLEILAVVFAVVCFVLGYRSEAIAAILAAVACQITILNMD